MQLFVIVQHGQEEFFRTYFHLYPSNRRKSYAMLQSLDLLLIGKGKTLTINNIQRI